MSKHTELAQYVADNYFDGSVSLRHNYPTDGWCVFIGHAMHKRKRYPAVCGIGETVEEAVADAVLSWLQNDSDEEEEGQ
jgi:hypothetical protein